MAAIGTRLEDANPLRSVDQKHDVPFGTGFGEAHDVGAKPGCKRHVGAGDDTRAIVDGGDHVVDGHPAAPRLQCSDLDPEPVFQMQPRVDVARMLKLRAQDHIVAGAPRDCAGRHVEPFGNVLRERNLIRVRFDQASVAVAHAVDRLEHARFFNRTLDAQLDLLLNRCFRGAGHKTARCRVEIDRVRGAGKVPARVRAGTGAQANGNGSRRYHRRSSTETRSLPNR